MNTNPFYLRVFDALYFRLTRGTKFFPKFLAYKGIKLGQRIWWGDFKTISIDFSRPSLVEIGSDVRVNTGFTLMTHDASNMILRKLFNDFVCSSGKVKIGNNVYFGRCLYSSSCFPFLFVMKNRQATCCLPAIYHENVFLLSELKPLPFLSYTS